jgi:hypothetical protein
VEGGCEEEEEIADGYDGGEVVDGVVDEGREVEGGYALDGGGLWCER